MTYNLMNENMRVKEEWLSEPFSSTICRYLESWDYALDSLKEFNDYFDEINRTTDIADILSSLVVTKCLYGLIIEDLSPDCYTLDYFSFDEKNDCSILKHRY